MGHRHAAEGYKVLVAASSGRDAEDACALLAREGYTVQTRPDLDGIAAALDGDVGAVLLTERSLADDAAALMRAVEEQPSWSDVPFVVLAGPRDDPADATGPARLRLPEAVTNTIVLERPVGAASLLSAVAAAMRSRQKQFEMRDRLVDIARSEGRLRLATRAADIGTWDFDPVGGTLAWDERCRALFGIGADHPVTFDGTFLAGLHPEDRDAAAAAVERALDPAGTGEYDIEFRTLGIEDGVERWIAARGAALFEGGRAVRFIGTVIDITARKASEAALRASEHALRQESHALDTLNRTGEKIAAELDLDRLVQGVVQAATELTGAKFGAFFYNNVDDQGESYMLYALAGAPRSAFADFPAPRKTALIAPTFNGEGPVRSGDITRDPRYGLSDTHWGMPNHHLRVRSYLAVPVISRNGEVIGGLLFGHPEHDQFDERAERLALGIAAQAAIAIDNARLYEAAQRARETLEEKVAARTAELEAEMASRSRAEAALRQSQKMEAVGQLTGGIAHDFNNMLTGVIGALDVMRRRIATGRIDDLDRFMDAATSSAQRAAALTARLLAFSRRQSLEVRPVDVDALATSLEELLQRSVREDVALAIYPAGGLPPAMTDANQLENAILNLVINARDAMPNGGTLTVETGVVNLDEAYAADRPDVSPGTYVMIAVSDTGVGIAPDLLDKVFEPFFSTKPIGQGTGLGLSMVYGFARQLGGHVSVHSQIGQGTSVKLYLPVAEAAASDDAEEAPPATFEGVGQTVLLVEDDDSVRLLVHEVLEELSYRVIQASHPQAAIPILASDEPLSMMVSDVGLPGMNGRQLAEIARQHRPDLPILFVTGYAENAANRIGFLGPNMSLITKPFAIETLSAKIAEMMPG